MKKLLVSLIIVFSVPVFASNGDGQIGIGSEAKYTDMCKILLKTDSCSC